MDIITLALAKKYVDEVVAGSGVRAGKNCTIQSITPVDGGNNVVFAWTNDDGTAATQTLFVADGRAGTAFIPSVSDAGDLSWTNDGGLENPAPVNIAGPEGPRGAAGVGVAAIVQTVTSPDSGGTNEITVKLTDGTEMPFNVKNGEAGATGTAGADGRAGIIFTPSVDPDTGDISWTNDGGLSNPASVNIRGPQGPAGESAVSAINPRGDYDATADPPYTKSDYITFTDGNTYVAKVDNPDNTPPTDGTANDPFWQIIAFRGAQGPQGERGLTGQEGQQGPAGAVYVPSVSDTGDLTWANNGGLENPAPVNIIGPRGPAGAVFTPTVTPEGDLSWLNDGGLSNPASVNIRGPEGPTGPAGKDGAAIDDNTVSTDTVWSSKKINDALNDYWVTQLTSIGGGGTNYVLGEAENYYCVKNGVCQFNAYITVKEKTSGYIVIFSGLPKPASGKQLYFGFSSYGTGGSGTSVEPLRISLTPDGRITANNGVTGNSYMVAFTYPVA